MRKKTDFYRILLKGYYLKTAPVSKIYGVSAYQNAKSWKDTYLIKSNKTIVFHHVLYEECKLFYVPQKTTESQDFSYDHFSIVEAILLCLAVTFL